MCQLQFIDEIGQENSWLNAKWQYFTRCLAYTKWAKIVIPLFIRDLRYPKNAGQISQPNHDEIQPGDMVRIRSKDEIQKTLDRFAKTRGCRFQLEMYNHCAKEYKVFKKVDHFFDEVNQRMCKCNDLFLLEGAHCRKSTCDRSCFFFWHVTWLQKI